MSPTAIDLFCGAGGLSLGASQAGFKLQFAADKDRNALSTYALNHPHVELSNQDVVELTSECIGGHVGIDLLLAGPLVCPRRSGPRTGI